jgi:putative ABC transport system permease protein
MTLGVAGGQAASHLLQGLIYGVSATDPITYAVAMAVIPVAAILGCWRPSFVAARANPVDAIRAE